jgi:nickel-type superoxide dismutase maturation protease
MLTACALFRRVAVVGSSMDPTVADGDRLLVLRLPRRARIRPGWVVAVADPRNDPPTGPLLVKRVHRAAPGLVEVRGDNPVASTDSRQFGPVPRALVAGRVLYRYHPPAGAGAVR